MFRMKSEYYMKKSIFGTKKKFTPESIFFLYDPNKFKGKDIKLIKIQNKLTIFMYITMFLGFLFFDL